MFKRKIKTLKVKSEGKQFEMNLDDPCLMHF